MDAEGAFFVDGRFALVDEHEFFARKTAQKSRRRVYGKRRSRHDERIGGSNGVHGAFHRLPVERFAVQHDVRLDDPPAGGAMRHALRLCDLLARKLPAAGKAGVFVDAAVQFKDASAPRLLMQPVDVLRDDGGKDALFFPVGEHPVRGVGLRIEDEHLLAVKRIKLRGMRIEKFRAQNGLGRNGAPLAVQSVRRAEIGDAALRGYARPAEKDEAAAFFDDLLQCHTNSFPHYITKRRPFQQKRAT